MRKNLGMDIEATYTPLECLLVFQSLAALGTDEEDFISISALLQKSPLVRNCSSYDSRRLEASALRQLYFELLRDDLRAGDEDSEKECNQSPAKMRKLHSASIPSINDCRQYRHKLPVLVERLYARYRDHMIKAIKEDERKYFKLQGQIKKIEEGDCYENVTDESRAIDRNEIISPATTKDDVCLEAKKTHPLKLKSQIPEELDLISTDCSSRYVVASLCQKSQIKSKATQNNPQSKAESPLKSFSKTQVRNSPKTPLSLSPDQMRTKLKPSLPATKKTTLETSPDTLVKFPGQQSRTPLRSPSIDLDRDILENKASSVHQKLQSPVLRPSHTKLKSKPEHRHTSNGQPLAIPESKDCNSSYRISRARGPSTPRLSAHKANGNSASRSGIATETSCLNARRSITGYGTQWTSTPTGFTPRNLTPLPPPKTEPLSPIIKSSRISPKDGIPKKKKQREEPKPLRRLAQDSFNILSKTPSPLLVDKSQLAQPLPLPSLNKQSSKDDSGGHLIKNEVGTLKERDNLDKGSAEKSVELKSSKDLASPRRIAKRKRTKSTLAHPQGQTTVLWTRAFPRISAQALQDISTDKNASMFANPIKEKDAPGYRNIILRPQDLKSIRSAITAGHRAALAAAPVDLSPNTTSVWLPISEDLIPPKGIVNYAQLEKELMRMFANAIMFNADPRRGLGPLLHDAVVRNKEETFGYSFDEDSVVKGTRDMFAAVEKKVSDLRSVERRNEKSWDTSLIKGQVNGEKDSVSNVSSHTGTGDNLVKRRRKV